jgi:nucleoside-diphosphate-sugar epimerase
VSRARRGDGGIAGISPTAGDLVGAVREAIPGARIEFEPDPGLVEIVSSWPRRVDGFEAERAWGWKERFSLHDAVADSVAELRAHPDWP